jgi:hypothetical protein
MIDRWNYAEKAYPEIYQNVNTDPMTAGKVIMNIQSFLPRKSKKAKGARNDTEQDLILTPTQIFWTSILGHLYTMQEVSITDDVFRNSFGQAMFKPLWDNLKPECWLLINTLYTLNLFFNFLPTRIAFMVTAYKP